MLKDFDMMLDELLDSYPDAAQEVEALRSKVGENAEDMGKDMMEEGEEMEMEGDPMSPFKPIPAEFLDEEESEEDDEEAAY